MCVWIPIWSVLIARIYSLASFASFASSSMDTHYALHELCACAHFICIVTYISVYAPHTHSSNRFHGWPVVVIQFFGWIFDLFFSSFGMFIPIHCNILDVTIAFDVYSLTSGCVFFCANKWRKIRLLFPRRKLHGLFMTTFPTAKIYFNDGKYRSTSSKIHVQCVFFLSLSLSVSLSPLDIAPYVILTRTIILNALVQSARNSYFVAMWSCF